MRIPGVQASICTPKYLVSGQWLKHITAIDVETIRSRNAQEVKPSRAIVLRVHMETAPWHRAAM